MAPPIAALAGAIVLGITGTLPAAAQDHPAAATVEAAGLTNPRGFTWDKDGTLHVALAGTGGPNLPTEDSQAIAAFMGYYGGPSAAVVRIKDGCPVTVADGLPSYIDGTGSIIGVSDLAYLDGQLYAAVDGGGPGHGNPDQPVGLYRINTDGSFVVVADLSTWMRANPVSEPPPADNDPDGEMWSLLPTADGAALWVVETNQGQLLQITPAGAVTRIADLSPGHPVWTGIAAAPDGGVYLATLTPFPFLKGTAKVVHVAPDGTVTDHWTGLTAVVALANGPEGELLALEMSTQAIDQDPFILPGTGRIVRRTGPDTMDVLVDGLDYPIAFDFGPDGALHVSTPALGGAAGKGTIVTLDLGAGGTGGVAASPAAGPTCFVAPAG